jgi:hypothetical protein
VASLTGPQRLKGVKDAIDSRIAEEQARQKAAGIAITRSPSTGKAGASTSQSPSGRQRKAKSKDYDAIDKGPDPSEFESAFVIEDESEEPSRAGTPAIKGEKMLEKDASGPEGSADGTQKENTAESSSPASKSSTDIPVDIRTKLKKLEMLESKYKGI